MGLIQVYSFIWNQFRYVEYLSQSHDQRYFTTGGLLPVSSSWRQAPWLSRPETFFLNVRIAPIACYWKFFLLHYVQVFCQSRLCKADHVYLTYLMLQRQLSHLNGRKLDHRQV
jgi:hypothetical protein